MGVSFFGEEDFTTRRDEPYEIAAPPRERLTPLGVSLMMGEP